MNTLDIKKSFEGFAFDRTKLMALLNATEKGQKPAKEYLFSIVQNLLPSSDWKVDKHTLSDDAKDRVDLYLETEKRIIVVEVDNCRRAEVASKIFSRMGLLVDNKKPVLYIALTYPYTQPGGPGQVQKFLGFARAILNQTNCNWDIRWVNIEDSDSRKKLRKMSLEKKEIPTSRCTTFSMIGVSQLPYSGVGVDACYVYGHPRPARLGWSGCLWEGCCGLLRSSARGVRRGQGRPRILVW